jgi:phospholipid/cholesterol/gamma-HCH transport system ATP-binding protein
MFTKQRKRELKTRVAEVLKRVNLDGNENKYPAEISGGMQKRVAIARAIVNKPKYLFCDKPNSGLDPTTATIIDKLILELTRENNITTVIITHDMNSVLEIGENIAFLKDGVLAWKGDKSQIFKTEDKTVTDFVYSSDLFKKVRDAQLKGY